MKSKAGSQHGGRETGSIDISVCRLGGNKFPIDNAPFLGSIICKETTPMSLCGREIESYKSKMADSQPECQTRTMSVPVLQPLSLWTWQIRNGHGKATMFWVKFLICANAHANRSNRKFKMQYDGSKTGSANIRLSDMGLNVSGHTLCLR